MKPVFKALFFQLKTSYLWKKVLLLFLLFFMLFMSLNIFLDKELGTVSKSLAAGENMPLFFVLILIFTVVACAEIFGDDFMDRTINHELLSGHPRADVYFTRAAVSICVSILGVSLLLFLPITLFSAFGYYGNTLKPFGLFLRLFLLMFPVFRLGCEIIFLTCILKNTYFSMAAGSLFTLAEQAFSSAFEPSNPYLMSVTTTQRLFSFSGWSTYTIKDLKNYTVYDSMPDNSLVFGTVVCSLLLGTLFLCLGYRFFRKDDLR